VGVDSAEPTVTNFSRQHVMKALSKSCADFKINKSARGERDLMSQQSADFPYQLVCVFKTNIQRPFAIPHPEYIGKMRTRIL
jgi:hypothetical protein